MKALIKTLSILLLFSVNIYAQENYKSATLEDSVKIYLGGSTYSVKYFTSDFKANKPKNVILMIGDGMGVAQVFAGLTANKGELFLNNFRYIGFSKTQSADNYITDSAAGGTALSTGVKTYNGAIGVDVDTNEVKNIIEIAEEHDLSTGLVSTSAITHATPASFLAHVPSRTMYEAIASGFLDTDIDVFIGGGYKHFSVRKDGSNLIDSLKNKGYKVLTNMTDIKKVKSGKLAGLTAPEHNARFEDRGSMLPDATQTAVNILSNDSDGFFLMVEGSQIDWGGHQNNTRYIVQEMLDFDQAIGKALEFAAKNDETLIIVTADHETGGFALLGGDMKEGNVFGDFCTGHHSGVMVPVFAFGPGAELFTGIMENTDIFKKISSFIEE